MKVIADTGLLIALLNRGDAHHAWAAQLTQQVDLPIITCEPVITEAAWHLKDSARLLELIEEDVVRLAFDLKKEISGLTALNKRFRDRSPDLADLCVVRLSEMFPTYKVATVDVRDFTVYRRFGKQSLPLLTP